jgi:hypothetical protein
MSQLLIAIDPGNAERQGRVCHGAIFIDGSLNSLTTFTRESARYWLRHAGAGPDVIVIEKPQMDRRSRKVPPKILIGLAWNGALVAGALQPSEWKGAINKHPHHMQLWRKLSPVEQAVLPGGAELLFKAADKFARTGNITKHKYYDALDAIGLGLRYLKRTKKP